MRPNHLKTKIFLDSGDPKETRAALETIGFLDGQTTNPSLIARNPEAQARLAAGKKFSSDEVLSFYQGVVKEVSGLIPQGSVSIEVYVDAGTTSEQMLKQAREFNGWIPNAHIKFPATAEGLRAAKAAVKEGMKVNMTLVFSQEQAAAVYAATRSAGSGPSARGAKKGEVFVSPFVGRLDDRGENGMDLIQNIIRMYKKGDGHVEVLAASVRNIGHFNEAIRLGIDIITAPLKVLQEWADNRLYVSDAPYGLPGVKPIPYQKISLDRPWQEYDIEHELTGKGLEKFAQDWNALVQNSGTA